jgi:hypothetical protein
MNMDQFSKVKCEKIADKAAADDFKVDFSADSVFSPSEPCMSEKSKRGFMDNLSDRIEEGLRYSSVDNETIKKFKVMLRFFKVKDSLNRLNKINNSVDELVSLKIPFGENEKRYQALANRLIRANKLRTQIQKEFL